MKLEISINGVETFLIYPNDDLDVKTIFWRLKWNSTYRYDRKILYEFI